MKRDTLARTSADAGISLLTFAVVCFAPLTVGAPLTWEGPFALGAVLGVLLLLRRRVPGTVLALSALVLLVYRTTGLYESGWAWPLAPALLTACAAKRYAVTAITVFVHLAFAVFGEIVFFSTSVPESVLRAGTEALWLGLPLALVTIRRQNAQRRAQQEALREQERRALLAEQRVEISRDVHDVVAHTLAVVGVHLSVAADALCADPDGPGVDVDAARAALDTAREARGAAMAELKAFVGDLRGVPQRGLTEIEALLDAARQAGLGVEVGRNGDLAAVSAAQSLAAYQVVREAVTNTLRHSGADRLTVRLTADGDELRVEISDDGAAASPVVPGHGLTGMRERVAAIGGSVEWESGDGFTVRAVLPLGAGGSAA
ncbi:signal transduction histidine kinase [Actinocorallia herbida]|uniref:histidine kinase n=1 Tax=Actinocorallia herbida TaxID=58109 RepID=A0A3N1CPG8_9ACTN|nr:sensor histidine kinase [Actinocorallia herbida]ROO83216.1 signal transduction histidine kinase [Actinocorallia herbida]